MGFVPNLTGGGGWAGARRVASPPTAVIRDTRRRSPARGGGVPSGPTRPRTTGR
jgi:hypothetical protein